jgi:hypothetical protein
MMRRSKQYVSWAAATALVACSLYPWTAKWLATRQTTRRLDEIERVLRARGDSVAPLDTTVSLRVHRLGPLLASWETIGGCGAGGTGGAGAGVKWIGRNTTGGLFQMLTMGNYVYFADGFNVIASTQITRDLGQKWNAGVFVPYVYKYYRDYLALPVDISNAGLGDINLLLTRRFGRINSTSLTAAVGLPTGKHDARYKGDLLTQEKQLGIGRFSGSLILDHTVDESWGLLVLGGLVGYRGGENELGNYRAPLGSLYGYVGYFMGPFVPVLGVAVTDFLNADRDRGIDQDVPLTLVAGNASIEWSNDLVAILAGISVPYSLRGTAVNTEAIKPAKVTGLQPWIAAVGISISPF